MHKPQSLWDPEGSVLSGIVLVVMVGGILAILEASR